MTVTFPAMHKSPKPCRNPTSPDTMTLLPFTSYLLTFPFIVRFSRSAGGVILTAEYYQGDQRYEIRHGAEKFRREELQTADVNNVNRKSG